jgi:iron(II)-dependent oxidoreductase
MSGTASGRRVHVPMSGTASPVIERSMSPDDIAAWLEDARARTLALVRDWPASARLGPRLAIVNPPLWELGHLGWFQELWILRHAAGHEPLRSDGDALYDSSAVPHDVRWDLPLPSWEATLGYLADVQARALAAAREVDPYFPRLSAVHEDMHGEAFAYTRQTLGYPAPDVGAAAPEEAGPLPGDAAVPGGTFTVGARAADLFVFDNERVAHEVAVAPFAIARAPVTQAELAAFVEDGGYARRELWSEAGWRWREATGARHPLHWRRDGGRWLRREFDRVVPLEPHRPAIHVCWFEADAYCRWAHRRLPSEVEWEAAAACEPGPGGSLADARRRYPWGDAPPDHRRANLDHRATGCADVAAHASGDSAFGCRQLLGNVWEWTASDFLPYPGFEPGPYRDYSQPWFGTHKVLRGGCFATRARIARNAYRNFYTPDRRDVWAGFRTCALRERDTA